MGQRSPSEQSSNYSNFSASTTNSVADILNPDMDAWNKLVKWADNFTVPDEINHDGRFQKETRRRLNANDANDKREETDPFNIAHTESLVRQQFQAMGIPDRSEERLPEFTQIIDPPVALGRNDDAPNEPFSAAQSKSTEWQDRNSTTQKSEEWEAQHEEDEDEEFTWERPGDKWFRLGTQILAWSVCGLIVGECCLAKLCT